MDKEFPPPPGPNWRYDHLFAISRRSWGVHAAVVSLTMLVHYDLVPNFLFWSWGSIMWGLTAALAYLGITYDKRASFDDRKAHRYGVYHSIVVGLIGLTWGGGALFTIGISDAITLFYTFVLGGTALGAVSSQHSFLRSCMLSIWTSIPPLVVSLAVYGPEGIGWPMAWLVSFFGITLSVIAVRMNSFLSRSVALASALDGKVSELTALTKELEYAQAKAEQADRSKSHLLAQASHDMRHPVHAIGLMAEVLRHRLIDPENLQTVERISQSVESLSQLFKSVLNTSALDLGSIEVNLSKVKLDKVLKGVISQFEATEHKERLRYVSCGVWVETDPGLLYTVVQNIVINALKYGEGAKVLVGCRLREGKVSIEIYDQGPGIEENDLKRIFEPFVRVAPEDLRKGDGLGLGLHIVQRLTALLDHPVRIQSIPGKGTCIAIDGLHPISPPTDLNRAQQKSKGPLIENLKVALVEPNNQARSDLECLITRWGCPLTVHTEFNGTLDEVDALIISETALAKQKNWLELLKSNSNTQIAVVADMREPLSELPKAVQKLKKPVPPMQLRSLLLTMAMKVQSLQN